MATKIVLVEDEDFKSSQEEIVKMIKIEHPNFVKLLSFGSINYEDIGITPIQVTFS